MDFADRALQITTMHLNQALASAVRLLPPKVPSATICLECDKPIPEPRRIAVPGCQLCIDCQAKQERCS